MGRSRMPHQHVDSGKSCRMSTSSGAAPETLARVRKELGFLLAADALADLGGVIGIRRIASAVRQAEVFECGACSVDSELDRLNASAMIVTGREVEAHRPTAAAAIVAVALPKRLDARGLRLIPAILPRADQPGDRYAHGARIARLDYRPVSVRQRREQQLRSGLGGAPPPFRRAQAARLRSSWASNDNAQAPSRRTWR